jgi:hypothetical protein
MIVAAAAPSSTPPVVNPADDSACAPSCPASVPANTNTLASAMTEPRRASGARHWITAASGTMTSPAVTPTSVSSTVVTANPGASAAKSVVSSAMPAAPSGMSPYSTLRPESRDASSDPAPTPIPNVASGSVAKRSDTSSTALSYTRIAWFIRLATR